MMGCDIHAVGQVYMDGKWQTGAAPNLARDYDSFAVLADVRNGTGFAGRRTGEGWPVISQPRGLPKDFEVDSSNYHTAPWLKNSDEGKVWLGDHSHSWLTLKEINDFTELYINGRTYQKQGVVTVEEWDRMRNGRVGPTEWCSGVSGPNILVVSENDAREGVRGATHVRTSWAAPAWECLETLKEIQHELSVIARATDSDPHHVRLVFGFDS